ncbi:MAG: VOC family protein [Alphaproteobacteria bacterium]|nr:VOC family protein [Alphaproteobacteria bacterium]
MIKPQLTHVGIYVNDLANMKRFYTEVFGLTVTDQGGPPDFHLDMVFMSADPGEHHQFVMVADTEKSAANMAQQISFLVQSLDEMRTMHDRIESEGLAIKRMVTHGNAWSFYFNDPEDNYIEVYAHTPWHIPQPVGVPFDLSQSDQEIMAQTEALCRDTQGFTSREERIAAMREMIGS